MKYQILPNAALQLAIENAEDKTLVKELLLKNRGDDIGFLTDLLEETGWCPNGRLYRVDPEHIAALTDAPILTDDMLIEDDGDVLVQGNVWWYPDYAIHHFGKELLKHGTAEFRSGNFGT